MENNELRQCTYTIYKSCIERMNALGLKGKRRDDAVMTYLSGATTVAGWVSEPLQQYLAQNMIYIVSVLGFKEIEKFVKSYEATQESY